MFSHFLQKKNAFCLVLRVKKPTPPIFVLRPTGTPVMWVIIIVIIAYAQNCFNAQNPLKNGKAKFHADLRLPFQPRQPEFEAKHLQNLGKQYLTTTKAITEATGKFDGKIDDYDDLLTSAKTEKHQKKTSKYKKALN